MLRFVACHAASDTNTKNRCRGWKSENWGVFCCWFIDVAVAVAVVAIVCVFGTVNPIFHFSCGNVNGARGMHDDHVYVVPPATCPATRKKKTTLDVTNGAHVQVESRHLWLRLRLRRRAEQNQATTTPTKTLPTGASQTFPVVSAGRANTPYSSILNMARECV